MQKHKFPYNWRLSEAKFTKDKGKVFSCFACGGGSTMGYKLAGFDVIGCNEIDAKVNRCYVANHSPRYNFLEDIRTLRERERERESYSVVPPRRSALRPHLPVSHPALLTLGSPHLILREVQDFHFFYTTASVKRHNRSTPFVVS